MSLVRLTVVPTELEAEMICSLVRTAGIDCGQRRTDIGATLYGGGSFTGGPFEVVVPETDLERARELLSGQS